MSWIPYQELDFANEQYQWYNIDTRDFNGVAVEKPYEVQMPANYRKNKDKYFHTPEEIKALLDRYYTESGGKGSWRMFSLEDAPNASGWDLKYITIVRHKLGGLLVLNRGKVPLKKSVLALPVSKRYLNFINKDE